MEFLVFPHQSYVFIIIVIVIIIFELWFVQEIPQHWLLNKATKICRKNTYNARKRILNEGDFLNFFIFIVFKWIFTF